MQHHPTATPAGPRPQGASGQQCRGGGPGRTAVPGCGAVQPSSHRHTAGAVTWAQQGAGGRVRHHHAGVCMCMCVYAVTCWEWRSIAVRLCPLQWLLECLPMGLITIAASSDHISCRATITRTLARVSTDLCTVTDCTAFTHHSFSSPWLVM